MFTFNIFMIIEQFDRLCILDKMRVNGRLCTIDRLDVYKLHVRYN